MLPLPAEADANAPAPAASPPLVQVQNPPAQVQSLPSSSAVNAEPGDALPRFGEFDDRDGFNGYVVSERNVDEVAVFRWQYDAPFYRRWILNEGGRIVGLDLQDREPSIRSSSRFWRALQPLGLVRKCDERVRPNSLVPFF